MDWASLNPLSLIVTMVIAAIPIMLAATGELVTEKSGVLNLGVEGMMITGAVAGFITVMETNSHILAIIAAASAGSAISMIFGVLTQYLKSNHVATGLALTIFGLGVSSLAGQNYTGLKPPQFPKPEFGILGDIPVLGKIVFGYDYLVYVAFLIVLAVWLFLKFSRAGLILRAIGENHDAAHALGYKVTRVRFLAIMFGGAAAGLGGAYLSLIRVPQWTDGLTAGAGWIALAIVVFGSWRPWRVAAGALLFGGVTLLQLNLQAVGLEINAAYLSMTPYAITILVLVAISAKRSGISANAPASLGKLFHSSA